MEYIVFDLEFNQNIDKKEPLCPFEIIQIGAIKLDSSLNTIDTFNRYVKPSLYHHISPFITELTGITTEQLISESPFSEVYKAYTEFIGGTDCVFCVWGISDIKELFRNAKYHNLNTTLFPKSFINIQPQTSLYLKLPSKKLLRLQDAVSMLNIPISYLFHNALHDAYYTAELFKKIYHPSILPSHYDPSYVPIRPKRPKKQIDFDRLIQQFEKMYNRKMTEEEQSIIKLAYKMGKTNQFLK